MQNREEIKRLATEQLARSGPAGISLSRIAGRMGFTAPALYRYFANRDELITELIVDAYEDLATAVEAAVEEGSEPRHQLGELAGAVRRWVLAHPHRYLLIAGAPLPGYRAPERTTESARRVLGPFVAVFARLPRDPGTGLDRQFQHWLETDDAAGDWVRTYHGDAAALRAAVSAWSRMHGVLSLELQGNFGGMDFDPELLFVTEVMALAGG
ncbi:TetR-family transcriptional regulator (plasmid) [Streptantibioticus cattleyicolor NRRL 8057 = DSM 46488]|nr:TetR-family transcriptional regulator [Streptantibioticus cattleyicolor NRRL 8057 = DSM 46488]